MTTMTMTAASAAGAERRTLKFQLLRLLDLLATWGERAEQRRMLAAAGETVAMDLGLSRAELLAEAEKPFWQR
jgi:uncharacterized protein YjiS (DUF1127 family)